MADQNNAYTDIDEDWVNDPMCSLERTVGIIRSPATKRLSALGKLIPRLANGVKVEYDLTYESGGKWIKGYKFTDVFTQALWLQPCNTEYGKEICHRCIDKGPTEEGWRVYKQMKECLEDEYLLTRTTFDTYPILATFPGSNIVFGGIVDLELAKRAVSEGAVIKPHPITTVKDVHRIKHFLPDAIVLKPTEKLYPLLVKAKKLWTTTSSETGMAAIMLGIPSAFLNGKVKFTPTYTVLYESLYAYASELTLEEKLVSLFSHPESGLVSLYHKNPRERIEAFFTFFKKYRHTDPKGDVS